jgi:enamine deaminase RidA (YjgF/YER057c/UK114 family)
MSSNPTESPKFQAKLGMKPICYRLAPDRKLLEDGCGIADCNHCSLPEHDILETGMISEIPPCLLGLQHHTTIGYDGLRRVAMMVTPECGGSFRDQVWEAVSTIRVILRQQGEPMTVTVQNVFLADANDAPAARQLFEAYYGEEMPLTVFVVQPPCGGVALAIEAWAISTNTVSVGYHGPHLVTVEHNGIRWIHASAGSLNLGKRTAYEQSAEAFSALGKVLSAVNASFTDVARVWLYQGNITEEEEDGTERYRELNRARTDFFENYDFATNPLAAADHGHAIYPASTGIGTLEHGLVTSCLAVQTDRKDVQILSLENPLQTSAFDYPKEYSRKSPKFSRAMAIRIGNHLTTWVSGTASIINAETVYCGDIAGQTEQTLDNIEKLIAPENFANQGWPDAGARLTDLAKIRVYVKHTKDFEACKAVCERRLGRIPAIYAQADVCRPDLLVEIEGVAFSRIPCLTPEHPDH